MSSFWDVQSSNRTKSYLLLVAVFAVVAAMVASIAYLFDYGEVMVPFALGLSLLYAVGGYWFSDKIVLGIAGARPADEKTEAYLSNTVEGLSLAAGIPRPKIYVINDPSPNAFATGRDPKHAVIAVTTGLLEKMNRAELEGVLAHEMSHIKNFDTLFMTTVIVLVGMISILSHMASRMMWFGGGSSNREGRGGKSGLLMVVGIVLIILGPILGMLVQLAISRKREFLADATGAQFTRNPEGLANALEKLKGAPPIQNANETTASLYISNPFGKVSGLFSTHPPLDERIKILRSM